MLGELMSELEKLNLEMLTFTMKKGKLTIKFYMNKSLSIIRKERKR